ncbi:MAG: hypothetical protein N0E59_22685 [Candidatus Thiodiazotropha taylori]|nr:hypothetical protein [Candidatus Thiodiazotropha taylori]MCW4285927.1 hypothetical protein [Candidatus Thiodiazotropha taylori]
MTDNTFLSDRRLKSGEVPQKVLTWKKTCPPMVVATLEMACPQPEGLLRIEVGLRAVVGVLLETGMKRAVGVPALVVSQEVSLVGETDQTGIKNPTIIPENTQNRSE